MLRVEYDERVPWFEPPYWMTYGFLGIFALGLTWVALMPQKQPDPQGGVAKGCLLIAVGFLILLGVLFVAGNALGWEWLSKGVSGICLFITFFVALGLVQAFIRKIMRKN